VCVRYQLFLQLRQDVMTGRSVKLLVYLTDLQQHVFVRNVSSFCLFATVKITRYAVSSVQAVPDLRFKLSHLQNRFILTNITKFSLIGEHMRLFSLTVNIVQGTETVHFVPQNLKHYC